jgi:hypothetical protein
LDDIMTEEVERMVAEVLAQQLGLKDGEVPNALGGDPLMAAVALSLMKRSRSERRDDEAARLRRVASIIGACPRCLGDDAACAECAGQGKPGYRAPPDREALLEWIERPLRRLGLCVSARNRQRMEHNHVGGHSQ